MLKIIQCFGRHCSCHHLGEYVIVGYFQQAVVGGELDLIVLIGGVEQWAAIQ
jgi:hypothetical protein